MSKKRERKASQQKILRIEGVAPVARLQELLQREPKLKLEVAARRVGAAPGTPKP
jgi:hypothetical protein